MVNLADPTINLKTYNVEIVYHPGKANSNADALSRNPVDSVDAASVPGH